MTTASTLAARCAVRFRDPQNNVIAATEWLSYLNEAYNKVNASTPLWPWLETAEQIISFTANSRVANLPTDVVGVNWAYDVLDDYRLIDQMGRGDFFHQDHLRSEVGQVVTYRVRGATMELNPTPSTNLTVACECILLPSALAADVINTFEATGGVAGNITVTGINVGDTLLSVGGIKDSDQSYVDFTSQFTITNTNTINNSGGSATTGYHLVVTWRTASGSGSPVWPSQYHDILIPGALAQAFLDDGNVSQAAEYEKRFDAAVAGMRATVLLSRTETNQYIRDTFWS